MNYIQFGLLEVATDDPYGLVAIDETDSCALGDNRN